MYGSYYIVCFSSDNLSNQLTFRKVESATFLMVEDWAYENCPDDYYIQSIEKVYCYTAAEYEFNGPTDAVLGGLSR